jgi:cell division protein FtsB
MSAHARAAAIRRRAARRSGIRWDRVGRVFLLGVLFAILTMYASPLERWVTQHRTASEDSAQLRELEAHNKQLKANIKALQQPQALEMRARQFGMVKPGEVPFVIEGLPRR